MDLNEAAKLGKGSNVMRVFGIAAVVGLGVLAALVVLAIPALAAEAGAEGEAAAAKASDIVLAVKGFSAALAIGMSAFATALAQSRIGPAGAGAMAEKPEVSGTVFILVAIPETMVILGFVVAAMLIMF